MFSVWSESWPNVGVGKKERVQQRSMRLGGKMEHDTAEALKYQYCSKR